MCKFFIKEFINSKQLLSKSINTKYSSYIFREYENRKPIFFFNPLAYECEVST